MPESEYPKKSGRSRNFHFRYLELCRSKNYPPVSEIKPKNNTASNLEFFGDKFRIDDWLLINDSLYYDQALQTIAIRMRKNWNNVIEYVDNERKAKVYKERPVILTKYVFNGFVDAIVNCILNTRSLNTLALEGLPLSKNFIFRITKALSKNDTLQNLSFYRSAIGDEGCEALCSTIKHLPNIEFVNLSSCNLSSKGASSITDMIKFQKIFRFSEGWQKSLRYRDVDPDSIHGLTEISMNSNPDIGDIGLSDLAEILKEDIWIKVVEMRDCGITDKGARSLLECLEINKSLKTFDIRQNDGMSDQMKKNIRNMFGKVEDGQENSAPTNTKDEVLYLRDKIVMLEEQMEMEIESRKHVENLNEQLHEQIIHFEKELNNKYINNVPEGYTLMKEEALNKLLNEVSVLKGTLSSSGFCKISSNPRTKRKMRKAKSETIPKYNTNYHHKKRQQYSKSEPGISERNNINNPAPAVYVEKNIGDTPMIQPKIQVTSNQAAESTENLDSNNFMGMDALKVFLRKKPVNNLLPTSSSVEQVITPNMLFMGGDANK